MNFVIPGLTRNPAINNTGALCAPLDTGLRRYDGVTVYMPDQYLSRQPRIRVSTNTCPPYTTTPLHSHAARGNEKKRNSQSRYAAQSLTGTH
jgi:hypothetical protein